MERGVEWGRGDEDSVQSFLQAPMAGVGRYTAILDALLIHSRSFGIICCTRLA